MDRSWKALGRKSRVVHGFASPATKPPEYGVWLTMKSRCYNPNVKSYKNYGGRGIQVCERWRLSYLDFIADLGPRPSKRHQIDRIDNDGDYEPSNCRWSTREEQCSNRRSNVVLNAMNLSMTIRGWSKIFGVPEGTINWRIRQGWDTEEAVCRPADSQYRYDYDSTP